MDRTVEYVDLTMFRPDLDDLPIAELPHGFSIRQFRVGEGELWAEIETRAGEFAEPGLGVARFQEEFGHRQLEMADRSFFLIAPGGEPIGTATAWMTDYIGRRMGLIHWVAIVPAFQGQGLSRPLLAEALRRLSRDETEACLHTQTWSWRAIGLYRAFGFQDVRVSEADQRGWAIVDKRLTSSRR